MADGILAASKGEFYELHTDGDVHVDGGAQINGGVAINRPGGRGAALDVNGAVIIGDLPKNGSSVNSVSLTPGTDFMLAVKGKVYCQEVNVTPNNSANWADYVFKKDYKLSSLEEVEKHIKEEGHLKDVPSAEEVTKAGYNVGAMDATLLRKIEELTLYILQQEKRIKELENSK